MLATTVLISARPIIEPAPLKVVGKCGVPENAVTTNAKMSEPVRLHADETKPSPPPDPVTNRSLKIM